MADTLKLTPMTLQEAEAECAKRGEFRLMGLKPETCTGMKAEDFIKCFLTDWNSRFTTVFFKPGDPLHDKGQCHLGARRSVGDVYIVAKYYIEGITILETRRILKKLASDCILQSYICSTIKRRVFWLGTGLIDARTVRDEFGWYWDEPTIQPELGVKVEQKVQYV